MNQKLFMMLLGCKPEGRLTEQHDMFFGIADTIKELVPDIIAFWPEAKGKIHVDVWRQVGWVNDYMIRIVPRDTPLEMHELDKKLFFLNLGGYKENEFDEYHYKLLSVASTKTEAMNEAKQTAFYQHTGFEGAPSHVDDKYGVDVDDVHEITDIIPSHIKEKFRIQITACEERTACIDNLSPGYQLLSKL